MFSCCLTWSVGWAVVLMIIPADSNFTSSQTGNTVITYFSTSLTHTSPICQPKRKTDIFP